MAWASAFSLQAIVRLEQWGGIFSRGAVRSSFLGHPGARFLPGSFGFWPRVKGVQEERTPAAMKAPSASLRSENYQVKSAVEMNNLRATIIKTSNTIASVQGFDSTFLSE